MGLLHRIFSSVKWLFADLTKCDFFGHDWVNSQGKTFVASEEPSYAVPRCSRCRKLGGSGGPSKETWERIAAQHHEEQIKRNAAHLQNLRND